MTRKAPDGQGFMPLSLPLPSPPSEHLCLHLLECGYDILFQEWGLVFGIGDKTLAVNSQQVECSKLSSKVQNF